VAAAQTAVVAAPTAAAQLAPTVAAAATQAAPTVATGGRFKVSILGKEMSQDEVAAELAKEAEVNVANWTFTANDAIVGRFQAVVKEQWGVDVKCNYLPSQSPSIYLTNLYTANQAGNPSPYDVMAIEEPYYVEAKGHGVTQDIFPSDLMKNWEPVDKRYLWIPKGSPHPLLAQLFLNWRISSDGLIPGDKWPSAPGAGPMNWQDNQGAWSEIFEGVLYAGQEKDVPAWFADAYKRFYPPFSDYDKLKAVDWDYYAANQKDWQDAESKGLGL